MYVLYMFEKVSTFGLEKLRLIVHVLHELEHIISTQLHDVSLNPSEIPCSPSAQRQHSRLVGH